MGRYHIYTPEELLYIEMLWREGASVKAIAWKLGRSVRSIQRVVCNDRERFPYRRQPYTDAEVSEMVRLWGEGRTLVEIAEAVGKPADSLSAYKSNHRTQFPRRRAKTTTDEQRRQMVEMRRSGMPCKEIAQIFGVSSVTVSQYTAHAVGRRGKRHVQEKGKE